MRCKEQGQAARRDLGRRTRPPAPRMQNEKCKVQNAKSGGPFHFEHCILHFALFNLCTLPIFIIQSNRLASSGWPRAKQIVVYLNRASYPEYPNLAFYPAGIPQTDPP
jgi:hypothetical protein